jgi:FixJ family two-component response regulator
VSPEDAASIHHASDDDLQFYVLGHLAAAEGKTKAEIAARLNISQRTVENHRASLMQRLGLQNQTELIRHARRHGLISTDE